MSNSPTTRTRRYYGRNNPGHSDRLLTFVGTDTKPGPYPGSVGGGESTSVTHVGDIGGQQITLSEGHPFRGTFQGEDQGGDFFTQRYWVETPRNASWTTNHPGWSNKRESVYKGRGPLLVNPGTSYLSNLFTSPPANSGITDAKVIQWSLVPFGIKTGKQGATSPTDLDAKGASMVADCRPAQSPAGLAAALIELKNDGLPDLPTLATWRDRLKPDKGVSGDFLNYQFGILPLISDIKDVGSAVVHREKLFKQLMRDNGRLIRRRLELDPIVDTETLVDQKDASVQYIWAAGGRTSALNSSLGTQTWRREVIRRTTDRYSFSGAFRYHLGDNMTASSGLSATASKWSWLLGLDLSPETLYQVTPWSWLIDWHTNLGDVISNVDSFALDGLVMPYGYVMRHRTVEVCATMTPIGRAGSGKGSAPAVQTTYRLDQKERRKANPFGFGLKYEGLSLKQKAILAALGITRVR